MFIIFKFKVTQILFLVLATSPDAASNGSWSDRTLATGRKLTGIGIKKGCHDNYIGSIRAR